jgi:hypothetical protein
VDVEGSELTHTSPSQTAALLMRAALAARPVGLPKVSDWDYVEEPAPELVLAV